jgi:hypothetical protein
VDCVGEFFRRPGRGGHFGDVPLDVFHGDDDSVGSLAGMQLEDGFNRRGGTVEFSSCESRDGECATGSGFVTEGAFVYRRVFVGIDCLKGEAFGLIGVDLSAPGECLRRVVELSWSVEGAEAAEFVQVIRASLFTGLGRTVDGVVRFGELVDRGERTGLTGGEPDG